MRSSWILRSIFLMSSVIIGTILVLMPFHAFLTVWLSSFFGHYTALRLWKEFLLVILFALTLYVSMCQPDIRRRILGTKVVWAIGAYVGLQVISGVVAYVAHAVGLKALCYGFVSDTRYLFFFICVLVLASALPNMEKYWMRFIFVPLAVVVGFGLLQYFVLPYDVLRHFGYNSATIFPYEDINSNLHYIRVMSTLRGANPLGAYLVLAICVLGAWWQRRRWWWYALMIASTVVLVLTFSRGAWLGLIVAGAVLVAVHLRKRLLSPFLLTPVVAGAGILCVVSLAVAQSTTFQNIFLHTQSHSAVKTTSNEGHQSAFFNGIHDLLHQPFGRGPGTAGPASIYNTGHVPRIAENYFIQIGQETGWVGLALFIGVNILVGVRLWSQRNDTLSLGLLLGLIGLSIVNFLSHAWADDTLAYMWWGLAGYALVPQKGTGGVEHL